MGNFCSCEKRLQSQESHDDEIKYTDKVDSLVEDPIVLESEYSPLASLPLPSLNDTESKFKFTIKVQLPRPDIV
jgi:hypothetical protein